MASSFWSGRDPDPEGTSCVLADDVLSDVDMAFIRGEEKIAYLAAIHGQLGRYERLTEAEISTAFMRLNECATP